MKVYTQDDSACEAFYTSSSDKSWRQINAERSLTRPFIELAIFNCVCNTRLLLWIESGGGPPLTEKPQPEDHEKSIERVQVICPNCNEGVMFRFKESELGSKIIVLEAWDARLVKVYGQVEDSLKIDQMRKQLTVLQTIFKKKQLNKIRPMFVDTSP